MSNPSRCPLTQRRLQHAARLLVSVVIGWVLSFAGPLKAQTSVSIDDLIAAILQTKSFTTDQLRALDLNGDNVVDVADLVLALRGSSAGAPVASFSTTAETISEGAGTIAVTVALNPPAACTLLYKVGGTAVAGQNFAALSGSVAANGGTATIPISIIDDAVVAAQQNYITLTLLPSAGGCYTPGSISQHTILIQDNDALWHGDIVRNSARLGIGVQIIRVGSQVSVVLKGGDNGTLPAGDYPATGGSVTLNSTSFHAGFDGLPVLGATAAAGISYKRSLVLSADGSVSSQSVARSGIQGTYVETWTPAGGDCSGCGRGGVCHPLCRVLTGTLSIAPDTPTIPRPVLTQIPTPK